MDFYLDLIDKRLSYLKDKFITYGFNVFDFCNDIKNIKNGDIVILRPSHKLTFDEASGLHDNIKVFSFNKENEEVLKNRNINHINFLNDEEFVLSNADLTAECVLCELLTKTELSLYDMNILLLGGGRVAKALGNVFSKLNVNYHFTTINKNELAQNEDFYNLCIDWGTFKDNLKNYNVVINTIPAVIFKSSDNAKFYKNGYVFEVASKHCVEVENEKYFNYFLCPMLPSKYLPKSAGELIETAIKKHINLTKK